MNLMYVFCYMHFMQSMMAIADEAIPRAAENIALAIGAFCVVRKFSMAVRPFLIFIDYD